MTDMDQLNLEDDGEWWYALIGAAPRPESDEVVNVGVLLGNGRPTHLGYVDRLPRLTGIVEREEANVYQAVLAAAAESIAIGGSLESLTSMIGPQMKVMRRRPLYQPPSDTLLERLTARFLETHTLPGAHREIDALIERSRQQLDVVISKARPRGAAIVSLVRPANLYDQKVDKLIPFRVPRLARAIRGAHRDLLVDSLLVEDGYSGAAIRQATARIGQAFFAWHKLRPTVKKATGKEVHLVGILHASPNNSKADTREMREYIKHTWSNDALIIDAEKENEADALRKQAAWVVEGE
jgi:hypothetical protein